MKSFKNVGLAVGSKSDGMVWMNGSWRSVQLNQAAKTTFKALNRWPRKFHELNAARDGSMQASTHYSYIT
jgi:hypothetical protein